ncbi:hypothetical protein B0H66DRAFT_248185 [Apodospora peruviana]|uniref:Uncharacterized protein n=1 Tax=Apodospora peruviana TaxID=516989 RepID=A0AAE0I5C7_9PEZI|nr:hypothetical protein B0H66DRAFT_248185 [Apodospora peruviana]
MVRGLVPPETFSQMSQGELMDWAMSKLSDITSGFTGASLRTIEDGQAWFDWHPCLWEQDISTKRHCRIFSHCLTKNIQSNYTDDSILNGHVWAVGFLSRVLDRSSTHLFRDTQTSHDVYREVAMQFVDTISNSPYWMHHDLRDSRFTSYAMIADDLARFTVDLTRLGPDQLRDRWVLSLLGSMDRTSHMQYIDDMVLDKDFVNLWIPFLHKPRLNFSAQRPPPDVADMLALVFHHHRGVRKTACEGATACASRGGRLGSASLQ